MCLKAKGLQRLLATTRSQKRGTFSLRIYRRNQPSQHLDSISEFQIPYLGLSNRNVFSHRKSLLSPFFAEQFWALQKARQQTDLRRAHFHHIPRSHFLRANKIKQSTFLKDTHTSFINNSKENQVRCWCLQLIVNLELCLKLLPRDLAHNSGLEVCFQHPYCQLLITSCGGSFSSQSLRLFRRETSACC